MATVTEKLRFLLETDASGAVKGFRQADASMTSVNKTAGMTRAQMVGLAATGGIVAGAMLKAANQFKNLAIESGKLAAATGLSVEQSSRWIEVLGDLEVDAGALETGLGRLNKTISASPEKLEALGVAVRRADNGAVDVNATFLALVDRLNAIEDPARRAEVATAALGRGWQELASVISKGSGGLNNALASVSDQKVISDEEHKRAEEYRESMQDLTDSLEELSIMLGESVVPALGVVASTMATVASKGKPAIPVLGEIASLFGEMQKGLLGGGDDAMGRFAAGVMSFGSSEVVRGVRQVGESLAGVFGWGDDPLVAKTWSSLEASQALIAELRGEHEMLERQTRHGNRAAEEYAATLAGGVVNAQRAAAESAGLLAEQELRATQALRDYGAAWGALTGEIDENNAMIDLINGFDAVADAHQSTADAAKDGADAQKKAFLDEGRAINDQKQRVIDYAKEILGLPPDKVTSLVAMVEDGELDALLAKLQVLSRNRNINLDIIAKGGAGYGSLTPGQAFGDGGVVQGPRGSAQVVLAHAGETILPTHKPGGGVGGVTIMPGAIVIQSAGPNYDGQALIEAIVRAERNMGTGWRT